MKMSKKLLSLLLCAIMVLGIAPFGELTPDFGNAFETIASAANTEGIFSYTVTDEQATITGCDTSASGTVEIPSTLGGYPVTAIGANAFYSCIYITSVIIPDGVTTIGTNAFLYCGSLTNITIPNSVTSIGIYAFMTCISLESITIPNGVKSIGAGAFGYTKIKEFNIPASVEEIGEAALLSLAIDLDAAELLPVVEKINVDKDNQYYSSDENGALYNKDKTVLIQYPNASTSCEFPNSIKEIADGAFMFSAYLTEAVIPDSVTSIGYMAFSACTRLEYVHIPASVTSIGDDLFADSAEIPGNAYICSDTNDCYAKEYAEANGIEFRTCFGHSTQSQHYTVIYDANGGSGAPAKQVKAESVDITLSTVRPAKAGYTFIGWSTSSSATTAEYQSGDTYTEDADVTLYAVWQKNPAGEGIYNLGEETYSFQNYGDNDSSGGHCFGMSMTSGGYYLGAISKSSIGAEDEILYSLSATAEVKAPICYYQPRQGLYSLLATVAGGTYYKTNGSLCDINSDWDEVVNYVKNHDYDNKGSLQIGFAKNGIGGHAINFLYYADVDGQQRIYAYDNNFPNVETYFYKGTDGKVYQAPKSTFYGSIDCISLRDIPTYFSIVGGYDAKRYFYSEKDAISIEGATVYPIETDTANGEFVMFEVPDGLETVTITPLVDNATFTYINEQYSFDIVDEETYGTFTLAQPGDEEVPPTALEIHNAPNPTANAVIRIADVQGIDYRSIVTIKATATDVPDGYKLAIYLGSQKVAEGDNKSVSYEYGELKSDLNYSVKVIDSNSKVQKDSNGNDLSKDGGKITVNAGFFKKLIAFFRGLFKSLPKVEVKP